MKKFHAGIAVACVGVAGGAVALYVYVRGGEDATTPIVAVSPATDARPESRVEVEREPAPLAQEPEALPGAEEQPANEVESRRALSDEDLNRLLEEHPHLRDAVLAIKDESDPVLRQQSAEFLLQSLQALAESTPGQ
jgi:hypothetical protein